MTIYTIEVHNKSAIQKDFFIFAQKPDINDTANGVFQNVFLTDTIAGGGNSSFAFSHEIYAVCGKAILQSGASVTQTFPSTELSLGTATTKGTTLIMQVNNGAVSFVSPYPKASSPTGCFTVLTKTDFNQGDSYFIGMGNKASDSSKVLTVASIQASPNATFNFLPHIEYYIATGNFKAGTIFDVSLVGATKKITFPDGSPITSAVYNPDGTWS